MKDTGTVFDHTEGNNIHLDILNDVNQVINVNENLQNTLDNIVNIVADKLKMDVCSIYFFDNIENQLILKATQGLNPESIEHIKIKIGKGVVSLAIEELKPIAIKDVQTHPRFLKIPIANEMDFKSFLALPILENKEPIGVLVVQKRQIYEFNVNEINMLRILSGQISSVIQVARILEHASQFPVLNEVEDDNNQEVENNESNEILKTLQGIPTSFGYGFGKVIVLDERYNFSIVSDHKIDNIQAELEKFHEAIETSSKEIREIKDALKQQISDDVITIFDSHIMFINDPQFVKRIEDHISKGYNASYSTLLIINHYVETFSSIDDNYIRDKIMDIEDIGRRLINNILGVCPLDLKNLPEASIIVAKFLTPSTTANLDTSRVAGIVTEHGGTTSHASILARSLKIPAVVGIKDLQNKINVEDSLIVDGNTGFVFLNPSRALIQEYERKKSEIIKNYIDFYDKYIQHPLKSLDNEIINVEANIGMIDDVDSAIKNGAKSVGLLRTEFLYMTHDKIPTMDEQYNLYKKVVESFPEGNVVIRTLDLGGDKVLPYMPAPKEDNPCLGYKSTRFLLDHPKIIFNQLQAILKASRYGNVKILFPMISSLSELLQLKDFIQIALGTLIYNDENISIDENIEIGIMIEVPSVIFQLDSFIPHLDFFSIGTNDLIQYLLAVDRDNENVSNLYNPLNPSILSAINMIAEKVIPHGKYLAVCGEMAGTPETSLALLSLGIRNLSVNPSSIPLLHYLVQQLNKKELDEIKENILSFTDQSLTEIYLRKKLKNLAPKL